MNQRAVTAGAIAIILIVARLAYIVIEGSYNGAVLDLVSNPMLTSTDAGIVENVGHKLAALGFALLLAPLIVSWVAPQSSKKRSGLTLRAGALFVVFLALFTGVYNLQAWALDKAVESTSAQTRYDAYYLALFRQLYLDGAISDPTLNRTETMGIPLLAAPFVWGSSADIPRVLRYHGSKAVLERAQKQAVLEDFETDYKTYFDAQILVKEFLARYQQVSLQTSATTDMDRFSPESIYGELATQIFNSYGSYQRLTQEWQQHLARVRSRNWFRDDVSKLFRMEENQREWLQNVILKKAGLPTDSISIREWCTDDTCPGSQNHIKTVLQGAITKAFTDAALGVPPGMSLRKFLGSHEAFNAAAIKAGLTNKPIFEISPVTLARFVEHENELYAGLNVSGALSDDFPSAEGAYIPAGLSNRQIVESSEFKSIVAKKYGNRLADFPLDLSKEEFFKLWLQNSRKLIQDSKALLLPEQPSDMESGSLLNAGYAAVRMIYIPPVAILISATMCILSALAVVYQVARYFIGSQKAIAGVIFLGIGFFGLSYSMGINPMPSDSLSELWSAFRDQRPVTAFGWSVLIGVEKLVFVLGGNSVLAIPAETINEWLEISVGWAV